MQMIKRFAPPGLIAALAASLLLPVPSTAIEPPAGGPSNFGFSSEELEARPSLVTYERGNRAAAGIASLQRFFAGHSDQWEVRWDTRGNRPNLVEGIGMPLVPGRGNGLAGNVPAGLADVESRVRGFLAEYPELLAVDGLDLRLDPARSVNVGANKQLWFIELQQYHNGIEVEGANAFFRVNNGNLIQFGADRLAEVRVDTTPRLDRGRALAEALRAGGFAASSVSEVVKPGTLKIVPALPVGELAGDRYLGTPGGGYRHLLVWDLTFRRAGDAATWEAQVDAKTGRVLKLQDANKYAQVTGGIYPTTNSDTEVVRPLPYVSVTNGASVVTDASGNYSYGGGTATATLNGRYIRINDNCGAISLSNSTTGDLAFGAGAGTDCSTPGVGGAGNTHSARSGFYHLTNINRKAATFLPGNAWLNGTLQANMNINSTCNAFWNGSTVNFYRSGGGCSNTGEIAAVFLHEWGHGMDTNSGGAASGDQGSGEAVGDTFAFLETKVSCIGANFRPGVTCYNCTTCTGVRDVADFGLGGTKTIAKATTIRDNAGINCDRFLCPYQGYLGPLGYEGHCESIIASSANWDLAQMLVAHFGSTAGWAAMDQIWYDSLTPSKSAYQIATGRRCRTTATTNGCGSTNWYTVYPAADDDDGNLANGTPNGCRIWDALNAHEMACGTRPACTQ